MGLVDKSSSLYKLEFFNFDIFFVDPILKSDKNSDLIVKNLSLYKPKLTVTLP